MEHLRELKEIEIARLKLSYAHTRIERPESVSTLSLSIERIGQIVPVVVLKSLVLLDGYLRVKALKRLGRDMVMAEIWDMKEDEALVSILARAKSRKWDLLERGQDPFRLNPQDLPLRQTAGGEQGPDPGTGGARLRGTETEHRLHRQTGHREVGSRHGTLASGPSLRIQGAVLQCPRPP